MKRRQLVVIVSAFTLLAVIFVMVVTIGVGVGTDPGREQIRSIVQQQLGNRIHGKVHLGKIRGGFLTSLTIDTFAIRDLEDSLLVSTGRISLNYDPRDLVDRRLLLRNVQIEHPLIRIKQHPKGDWNFQRIFRRDRPSGPNVPGRSFGDYVVLDSVQVRDGQVIVTRRWEPDDSLSGARRDSAIRVNLASTHREIRREGQGFTHTYRWTRANAFLPHVRLADPDSNKFGMEFNIASLRVEETEPPFSFRGMYGVVRRLGDSVFIDAKHFDLPASTGSARAKVWWGSDLPVRLDVRIRGDSVSLRDVAWVYPTLPTTGGGRTNVHIYNNRQNLRLFEYALSQMDVRSTRSHLTGDMTFVVGGPVLAVTDVDLKAAPVNFDLLRTLAGAPFPVDWQGDLYGYVRGPGGPLTHFVVDESDVTFRDAHVAGAVSRVSGQGELDILRPAFTVFHGFEVNAERLDLRSVMYLFPSFPRIGGIAAGVATLDSSWLDVRFSKADVTHRNGPGEPTRVTGAGRITYGTEFMTYDVNVFAQPVSLTMMSRAYPLGLKGLLSGPIAAKGTTEDMQLTMDLAGQAGRISYSGRVDAYPLSVAARGGGRLDALDVSQLVADRALPRGWITGTYQLDVRGDTNDIGTLRGRAATQIERSEFDGNRVFPSHAVFHFADGRAYVDTLRIESVAATITAQGALGLTPRVTDTLRYRVVVDSLGGLRRYVTRLTSSFAQPVPGAAAVVDSMAGAVAVTGAVSGALTGERRNLNVSGQITGSNLFVRREAGREILGSFAVADLLGEQRGTASVKFRGLNVGGVELDTLGASVRFDATRTGAFAVGAMAANGVTFNADGDLDVVDSGTYARVRRLAVVTDSSRWQLRAPATVQMSSAGMSVDSLVLSNGAGGRVSLAGTVPDTGHAKVLFRADSVSLRDVGQVMQLRTPLSGWAYVTAQGAGTTDAPVANLQSTLNNVRYGGVRLERVSGNLDYLDKRVGVAVDLARTGRTALVARGNLPLELRYFGARLLEDSLRGSVRTDSASFDLVEAIIPGLRDATGRLAANLDIAGTWKHPDLAGALRVDDGEVTVDALGIRMRGVNVDLGLFGHRDSLAIRRLSGWSGTTPADSASLRGYIAYGDPENPYLDLRLRGHTFHALDKRSLARLDISTEPAGVRLRGNLRGATLTGGLVVDRGTIFLPDPALARKQLGDIGEAIDTSAAARQLMPTAPSRLLESILMDDVRVRLGDDVWLRSREANIKLGGTLNVRTASRQRRGTILGVGTAAGADSLSLALEGELRAERGIYALVLGPAVQREFQVESGTITFYGTPELSPTLDISALHRVHTASREDLRIRVRLTGPVYPNPIVSLESAESFALSQSDLVSYLIFGQPNFELGEQGKSTVALAAQTLLPTAQTYTAAQLRNVLGSWADVVQFRLGSPEFDRTTVTNQADIYAQILLSSRVGAEKQLGERWFVSFSTGLCPLSRAQAGTGNAGEGLDFSSGLSARIDYRVSRDASFRVGKEPSAQTCAMPNASRIVQTPSQFGVSLFKSWRF